MLLSIIIPNFNSGTLLESSIRRLFQQPSEIPFEVWIMDNCSSDGSTDFLLEESFSGVHLVSEKDRGIYHAMNQGIQKSSGDWLYFLGAGDQLFPELLQKAHFSSNSDFIYGEVDQNPGVLRGEVSLAQILHDNICHQGIFYRRQIFEQLGPYNTQSPLLADHLFNIRIFFNPSFTKTYLPLTVAYYLGGGASSRKGDQFFRKTKKILILKEFLRYPSFYHGKVIAGYFWIILQSKFA